MKVKIDKSMLLQVIKQIIKQGWIKKNKKKPSSRKKRFPGIKKKKSSK